MSDVSKALRGHLAEVARIDWPRVVRVQESSEFPLEQLKHVLEVLGDMPPLPPAFFRLCEFAAGYYQAPLGEVILQGLPPGLKKSSPASVGSPP